MKSNDKAKGKPDDSAGLAQQAHDYLMALGILNVRFADIERAPRYPNGDRENDIEHSFHLALSATELAANYHPELDTGLVAQFSLVHDLPELHVGDTWTLNISEKDRGKKELAEKEATKRLLLELPPHTAQLLRRYEEQQEPEAKFVRFVDKLMPTIINMMSGDASTFGVDHDISNVDELEARQKALTARYQTMFPDYPFIHLVNDLVSKTMTERMFRNKNKN